MVKILDGRPIYQKIKKEIVNDVTKLKVRKVSPKLAIISFATKSDSQGYLKVRKKLAAELDIELEVINYVKVPSEKGLIKKIKELNANKKIHGIIIDRPLPQGLTEYKIFSELDPLKDIDGCHPLSSGNLMQGYPGYVPSTSAAIVEILKHYQVKLEGTDTIVIGRSKNVGLPMFPLLNKENATVTLAHSKTKELAKKAKQAQLIVVAVGIPNFIKVEHVNQNTILIDVGTNYLENGKLVGDTDPKVYSKIKAYSPVPGGVGPVTNIILFRNLISGLKNRYEK